MSLMILPFLFIALIVCLVIALLVTIGIYVYRDAPIHGMDPVLWTLIAVLVPNLIGFIIYLVVRSGKKNINICPNCKKDVYPDYLKCPYCNTTLAGKCSKCGKTVQPDWKNCPYCSNELESNNTYDIDNRNGKNKKLLKVIIGIIIMIVILIISIAIISAVNYSGEPQISIMSTTSEIPIIVNELLGKGSVGTMESSYSYWNDEKEHKVKVKETGTLEILYDSSVEGGSLKINLLDENHNLLENIPINEKGQIKTEVKADEIYYIKVVGTKTKGMFDIKYKLYK